MVFHQRRIDPVQRAMNERTLMMKATINQDVWAGKWKQFRGKVLQWWGRLTRDRLGQMRGAWQQFLGWAQERYGYFRSQIEMRVRKPTKRINIKWK